MAWSQLPDRLKLNSSAALSFATYFSQTAIVEVVCGGVKMRGALQNKVIRLDHLKPIRVSKPMIHFQNNALPTCVLALSQPIGFWSKEFG
jgi:hypothetical protein